MGQNNGTKIWHRNDITEIMVKKLCPKMNRTKIMAQTFQIAQFFQFPPVSQFQKFPHFSSLPNLQVSAVSEFAQIAKLPEFPQFPMNIGKAKHCVCVDIWNARRAYPNGNA